MKTSKKINRYLVACIAILVISLVSVAMTTFCKATTNSRYGILLNTLKKGDIAEQSVYVTSSVDIIDAEATKKARINASNTVLPVFSFNSLSTIETLTKFENFRDCLENSKYEEARKFVSYDILDKILDEKTYETVGLAYDIMRKILIDGYFDYNEVLSVKNNGYESVSIINNYLDQVPLDGEKLVPVDSLNTSHSLTDYIQNSLKDFNLTADDLLIVDYLIKTFSSPNVLFDEYLTEIRRKDAYNNCEPVVVSFDKNQEIIAKDHVIKEENLYSLKLLSSNTKISTLSIAGDFVFELLINLVVVSLIFFFFGRTRSEFKNMFVIFDFVFLSCIYLAALAYFTAQNNLPLYISIYPVIFVPVLAVMMTGYRRVGYSFSLLTSVLMARIPGIGLNELGYFLIISFSCCLPIKNKNKRLDMIKQWFISLLFGLVASITYILVSKTSIESYIPMTVAYCLNLTMTYILLSIVVPVLEKLMNLPTPYRLHELAYTDSPALSRLAQIAPGTYTHSCAVADLAEAAAKAVGANSLLCRVGALYHDIGKTEHPEYFVENQNGENKHDDINPALSASIIKNHIKVGAQKGKALGLPQEIVNMIEGHHGNDVISYFYNEALKEGKQGSYIESDYTYESEVPVTKELGILMLADSVEAASRTVTPNPQKYTKLIENIFLGKIERHQLSNNDLTMSELNKIKIVFIKTLLAKNHSRIEYPDQEEE